MAQEESNTNLAEIHTPKESEPVSGSARTSVAKLPKLGLFSTSKCTAETELTQTANNEPTHSQWKADKVSSKPPSRQTQSREEASVVSAQRLDIRIDLPNATSTITARRSTSSSQDKGRGLDEEKTVINSKNKTFSNSPQIWERSKHKGERSRTKTWPSLQYKLWLDASNLPLHLLCNDERATRPTEYLKSRERKRLSVESSGSFKAAHAARSINDWSAYCLSVSKPPVRPNMSSCGTPLSRMRKESREGTRDKTVSSLQVGNGQSWQVTSSYTDIGKNSLCGTNVRQTLPSLTGLTRHLPQPRLPSRMGRNNLESFLKQNTPLHVDIPHSGDSSNTAGRPPGVSPQLSTVISGTQRHFCNTSAEVNLLTLRSYARNPKILQEVVERGRLEQCATLNKREIPYASIRIPNELELDGEESSSMHHTHRRATGGLKQVRFKVPCGKEEDGVTKGLVRTATSKKDSEHVRQLWSDVTPPPTPPTFDQTYRIKCYITPIRSGSND